MGEEDALTMVDRLELAVIDDGWLEVEELGCGEPVIVIQTALTSDELRPMSQHIARSGRFRVLHYHRRGYANSSPAQGRASMAADAADAGGLIRAMAAEPAHVVGVSYSAGVALALAGSSPELVQTLSVVEVPPTGTQGAAEFQQVNLALMKCFETRGAEAALEEFMTMLVGPDWREVSERDLPGSVEAMERDAATFFTHDIPALMSWRFGAEEAAGIRCPLLYIGGGRSAPWFTQMRKRLVSLLPHVDQATVAGAGHLAASTHSHEVAQLLVQHFRRHPRAALR